jgi:hypothetical protein
LVGGWVIFLLRSFLLSVRGVPELAVLEVYVERVHVEVNRELGVRLLTRRGDFLGYCSPVVV